MICLKIPGTPPSVCSHDKCTACRDVNRYSVAGCPLLTEVVFVYASCCYVVQYLVTPLDQDQNLKKRRFTHIAGLFSELVAVDEDGRLCQWRWDKSFAFHPGDPQSPGTASDMVTSLCLPAISDQESLACCRTVLNSV